MAAEGEGVNIRVTFLCHPTSQAARRWVPVTSGTSSSALNKRGRGNIRNTIVVVVIISSWRRRINTVDHDLYLKFQSIIIFGTLQGRIWWCACTAGGMHVA